MTWPRDDTKLDGVRAALAYHDLDALVVRAPDNVLYLTNYWGMKGYEIAIFPREGDATLVLLEPSIADAERNAWTADHRIVLGYDPGDPRPPAARALERAQHVAVRELGYERLGLELSLGTQASDRMVGEPTTYTKAFFEAFDGAADATPLLNACRSLKTEQELERMRLANEIADLALAHVRERLRPGMKESEVGAMWEGAVHAHGVGFRGRV
ncbi:MAG TPA: aminopeptidase P family N-terminal domain-containing protein, partial [Gaiellaceae bacterium]|nr:aminopeptidase P family N-terminal domain-containing protein [Gaiellaceae bacterium]